MDLTAICRPPALLTDISGSSGKPSLPQLGPLMKDSELYLLIYDQASPQCQLLRAGLAAFHLWVPSPRHTGEASHQMHMGRSGVPGVAKAGPESDWAYVSSKEGMLAGKDMGNSPWSQTFPFRVAWGQGTASHSFSAVTPMHVSRKDPQPSTVGLPALLSPVTEFFS